MILNYGTSFLYLFATLWIGIGFYLYKKTEKDQTGISWIGFSVIVLNCFHCLIAALLDLATIPVNLISVSIIDILVGAWFWFKIYTTKEFQKYKYSIVDALCGVSLIIFLVLFTMIRFGGVNLNVNFLVADAACHFRETMDFINSQKINSMFYEFVCNGLFIGLLGPFTTIEYYYKWFVLAEVINFGLSGFVFYGVIRRYSKSLFTDFMAYLLTFSYLIGYPMNSTIFGFVYLGMSITLITILVMVMDVYIHDEIDERLSVFIMMLCCLGVFESYVLFAPATYFAVIFVIFYKQWKAKKLVSWNTIIKCLATFLLPCIIGLWYTYRGVFKDGVTVSSALVVEGGIYRELYCNFVLFLPGIILGYYLGIKKKKLSFELFLTPCVFIHLFYMLYKALNGEASSYYYYKMYYLLWMILLLLVFRAIVMAEKEACAIVCGTVIMWIAICGMNALDIEQKIRDRNNLLCEVNRAHNYVNIVAFNWGQIFQQQSLFCSGRMDLYSYASRELVEKEGAFVPIAAHYEEDLWYQVMTNQRYWGWGQSDPDHTDYFQHYNSSNADYVVVLTDSVLYIHEQEFYDSLERIYENDMGFIAVFEKNPKYGELE